MNTTRVIINWQRCVRVREGRQAGSKCQVSIPLRFWPPARWKLTTYVKRKMSR